MFNTSNKHCRTWMRKILQMWRWQAQHKDNQYKTNFRMHKSCSSKGQRHNKPLYFHSVAQLIGMRCRDTTKLRSFDGDVNIAYYQNRTKKHHRSIYVKTHGYIQKIKTLDTKT